MGSKSKAHKKKKVSKHVLKAREEKEGAANTAPSEEGNASTGASELKKRKQKKNRHVKDPSEAAGYLEEWKKSRDGESNTWKFNKNTQSWLIRHMYEADKIPKSVFTLLLDYLAGLEGKTTKTWIRGEASRRALRYKSYEKQTGSSSKNEESKEEEKPEKAKNDDEREEEERWMKLNDHDKRKEYKRARKVLETVEQED